MFRPKKPRQYRIVWRWFGFEPQMSYNAGMVSGLLWYPLNSEGYWLEPEAFSWGKITKRARMSLRDARRAILRARAINQQHLGRLFGDD